jgi:hypothetical protein
MPAPRRFALLTGRENLIQRFHRGPGLGVARPPVALISADEQAEDEPGDAADHEPGDEDRLRGPLEHGPTLTADTEHVRRLEDDRVVGSKCAHFQQSKRAACPLEQRYVGPE